VRDTAESRGSSSSDAVDFQLWGERDEQQRNPFKRINNALVERSAMELYKCRGLIYLLLTGLRGLPKARPAELYRGIRERVDVTKYKAGSVITWHGFTSTTTNLEETQRFLTNRWTGKCEGTLFRIRGQVWGYDVQPFSFFPDEEEILLEPEIDLKVVSVSESDGLLNIDVEMVPCPLLLEKLIPFAHT